MNVTDHPDQTLPGPNLSTMLQKISYRQLFIKDCSGENPDFLCLFDIFRATLKPGMPFREFKAYYYSARLEYIDTTLILADRVIIGFCAAAFYSTDIGNRRYIIGRAATGILEGYRGHTLPKWKLYGKYIRYWFRHPFRNILLSAYVANPLIYAMICKYTGIAYPRASVRAPEDMVALKNELLRSQRLDQKEGPDFVVKIHFCVAIGPRELERIYGSKDPNINYFLRINPKFRQQHGVVVIIPVNGKNILLSSLRFLWVALGMDRHVQEINFM